MSQLRRNRGLAKLNRTRWERIVKCPSSFAFALSGRGCAVRHSLLKDVARFMDELVSDMDFTTHKIGVVAENGFLLRTWAHIAERMGVPEWRVKDCKEFAMSRGWITSEQPKELDEVDGWVCLASIKRVTAKYFEDLNLVTAMEEAKASSIQKVVAKSKASGLPVAFYLTPISLLRQIRKTLTTSWTAYFEDYHKRKCCADIPY